MAGRGRWAERTILAEWAGSTSLERQHELKPRGEQAAR